MNFRIADTFTDSLAKLTSGAVAQVAQGQVSLSNIFRFASSLPGAKPGCSWGNRDRKNGIYNNA